MNDNLKYGDITDKIIGATFEVHIFLGNGFQEVIYQRALAVEMARAGLTFAREIDTRHFLQRSTRTYRYAPSRFRGRRKGVGRIEGYLQIGRCTHSLVIKLSESLSFGSRFVNQFSDQKA